MPNSPRATTPDIACPECNVPVFEHQAGACLDRMVSGVMGEAEARPYSSEKSLVFDILDRVEGDLLSGMAVAVEKVEETKTKLELNKAVNKWWVKIYYGDRGGSIRPVVDASAALAVSRAVVLADYALKLEAGPEESIVK